VPFDADNLMGILTAHLYHTPVHPRVYPECERMSPAFEAVILKCLGKTKEARYDSLDEVREELERVRAGESSRALDDSDQATAQFHRDMLPGLRSVGASGRTDFRGLKPGPETIPPALEGDTWVRPSPIMESSIERSSAPTMGPPSVRPVPVDTAPGVSVVPAARASAPGRRWGWLLAGAVVSAGVMLGVGGYALVGRASTPPDEAPPVVEPRPQPVAPAPRPVEPPRPRILPALAAPPPPAAGLITLRTNVSERGRVLRGRTGAEIVGEINPQALVLPRPHGAPQAYRIEVDGYEPVVVELHEADPAEVLVPLSESQRRRHHRPDAAEPAAHPRPTVPTTPTVAPPTPHADGLRDPWNN